MENSAWVSCVRAFSEVGMKQGIRWKFREYPWSKPQHRVEFSDLHFLDEVQNSAAGYLIERECFPEAAAVWNHSSFSKAGDLFYVSGFMAAKGVLASILANCDLAESELVPFDILDSDLKSLIADDCYFINFGSRKSTFISGSTTLQRRPYPNPNTGDAIWGIDSHLPDGTVALKPTALTGADFWVENDIEGGIFSAETLPHKL